MFHEKGQWGERWGAYIQKASDVAGMIFKKILIKSLKIWRKIQKKLAENPITSKKLAGIISPASLAFRMYEKDI